MNTFLGLLPVNCLCPIKDWRAENCMALLSVQPEILMKYWHQIRRKRGFDFFFFFMCCFVTSSVSTQVFSAQTQELGLWFIHQGFSCLIDNLVIKKGEYAKTDQTSEQQKCCRSPVHKVLSKCFRSVRYSGIELVVQPCSGGDVLHKREAFWIHTLEV